METTPPSFLKKPNVCATFYYLTGMQIKKKILAQGTALLIMSWYLHEFF